MAERSKEDCFVVAIDGPAGAGKSTTSKRVAEELGLAYLDTGAIYRCVALRAIESSVDLEDGAALACLAGGIEIRFGSNGSEVSVDGRDVSSAIRTPEISQAASKASAQPELRKALVSLQRGAAVPPGIVAEGRDMGTVIFPDAGLKVFLSADERVRAERRAAELLEKSGESDVEQVHKELLERDKRDSSRESAPLAAAADALTVDSTEMDVDTVVATIVAEARRRMAAKP